MSDVTEGIGGAIEGALAGRAVESEHAEGANTSLAATTCLNCGAEFASQHCPQCGQKRDVHRSLAAIGHDIMHGVLHLDGKLWRTLPLLVFKPGKLTRRYIDGERAKFVSPMAMFLFTVFAMFAVFQMVGLTTPTDLNFDTPAETIRANGEAQAEQMRAEIATMAENDPLRGDRERELEILESFLNEAMPQTSADDQPVETTENATIDTSDGTFDVNPTGIMWIDEGLIKKWQQNPGLMLYKLQANGYKFSWLLIPLSIPFVWLTFAWRRRFKAYDHAIFVTYSLSFMSLLFIAISLIAVSPLAATGGWAFAIFAIAAPLHIYKHLKYTYGLSRFSTIWRFFVLLVCIIIILALFLQALLVLGAF